MMGDFGGGGRTRSFFVCCFIIFVVEAGPVPVFVVALRAVFCCAHLFFVAMPLYTQMRLTQTPSDETTHIPLDVPHDHRTTTRPCVAHRRHRPKTKRPPPTHTLNTLSSRQTTKHPAQKQNRQAASRRTQNTGNGSSAARRRPLTFAPPARLAAAAAAPCLQAWQNDCHQVSDTLLRSQQLGRAVQQRAQAGDAAAAAAGDAQLGAAGGRGTTCTPAQAEAAKEGRRRRQPSTVAAAANNSRAPLPRQHRPAAVSKGLGFTPKPDAAALFSPVKLGALSLKHRVVMAPLTRCR